jgi:hypothetical protein
MVLAGSDGFSGGALWGATNDPSLALLPVEYQSLRFGPSFSYSVETTGGLYVVRIGLLEPNATRNSQRVFTVTVNGRPARVDIYRSIGLKTPLTLTFMATVDAANPSLYMSFVGSTGNAVVSWIDWARVSWADL